MFNYEKGMYNALVPTVIEQTGKGERAYDIFKEFFSFTAFLVNTSQFRYP